jgi:hypothetical protein
MVFGDSHAGSMLPAFTRYAKASGVGIAYAETKACTEGDDCLRRNAKILAYVREQGIRSVFIIFRWSNYEIDDPAGSGRTQLEAWLERTVSEYRRLGVHVHLVADNPLQRRLPEDALRRSRRTDAAINAHAVGTAEVMRTQQRLNAVLSRHTGPRVTLLDFTGLYCRKDVCPLVKDGRFLYADLNHLSFDGAYLAYPELKKALESVK